MKKRKVHELSVAGEMRTSHHDDQIIKASTILEACQTVVTTSTGKLILLGLQERNQLHLSEKHLGS